MPQIPPGVRRKTWFDTDSHESATVFSGLPKDIPGLCMIRQGLLIREGWAGNYGVSIPTRT